MSENARQLDYATAPSWHHRKQARRAILAGALLLVGLASVKWLGPAWNHVRMIYYQGQCWRMCRVLRRWFWMGAGRSPVRLRRERSLWNGSGFMLCFRRRVRSTMRRFFFMNCGARMASGGLWRWKFRRPPLRSRIRWGHAVISGARSSNREDCGSGLNCGEVFTRAWHCQPGACFRRYTRGRWMRGIRRISRSNFRMNAGGV